MPRLRPVNSRAPLLTGSKGASVRLPSWGGNPLLYPCPPEEEGGCGALRYQRCHTRCGEEPGLYWVPMTGTHRVRPTPNQKP
jgi:hypothetical protein